MKQQKQLIIFFVVIILALLVWVLFFREPKSELPITPVSQPTVSTPNNENSVPKLNNSLETKVTVVEPSDAIE